MYHFNFKYLNLTIGLTETVNIDDLPINTDVKDYEISKIFTSNKNLVEINNKVITPKDVGETKIYVQINFEDEIYESYFNLKIINYDLNKEEDLTYTQNITKVDDEFSLLKLVVRKNNKDYTNYSVTLIFNNANDIKQTFQVFSFYEVLYLISLLPFLNIVLYLFFDLYCQDDFSCITISKLNHFTRNNLYCFYLFILHLQQAIMNIKIKKKKFQKII